MKCCGNCIFYEDFGDPQDEGVGSCRRFPPLLIPHSPEGHIDSYLQPLTDVSRWCGEHSPVLADEESESK